MTRAVRSAIFLDFENVALAPDAIANWLAWLEDGRFADGRRRRFDVKRIYWNSAAEKHRERYEAHRFDVVLCEKFSSMKNGADIRMAMDIVEVMHRSRKLEEFILVTTDSDFVPVLQRLGENQRRTAIVVNESRPEIHTIYRQHADILIPQRLLIDARGYVRPKHGLGAWVRQLFSRTPKPARAAKVASQIGDQKKVMSPPTVAADVMTTAVDRVIKVISPTPKKFTAQSKIVESLSTIPGFANQGKSSYFGKGSYKSLMRDLAKLDRRVHVVDQVGGGIGVKYEPTEER